MINRERGLAKYLLQVDTDAEGLVAKEEKQESELMDQVLQ